MSLFPRLRVRKNSAGSTFTRRRLNFIQGTNVTLTVADDATDEEVDVTIAASGGSGGGDFEAPGDTPPGSPSSYDDEFDDSSIDAKWSWTNQGGATITETDFLQLLVAPNGSGDNFRIRKQTGPTTNWTLTSRIAYACRKVNFNFAGLLVRNNSNSKLWTVGWGPDSGGRMLRVTKWTNETTFSADLLNETESDVGMNGYFRITKTGATGVTDGTLTAYWSPDGWAWVLLASEAVSTFLGSADQIGFCANTNNTTADSQLSCYWFRVTEP